MKVDLTNRPAPWHHILVGLRADYIRQRPNRRLGRSYKQWIYDTYSIKLTFLAEAENVVIAAELDDSVFTLLLLKYT